MAYSADVRHRARRYYVTAGWSLRRIAREMGVSKTTLIRWKERGDWVAQRREQERIQREASGLALDMIAAARTSGDPQQAYAAVQAAKVAGLGSEPEDPNPEPAEVAEVLLEALAHDPELGPLVRRRKRRVMEAVLDRLERMSTPSARPDSDGGAGEEPANPLRNVAQRGAGAELDAPDRSAEHEVRGA